MNVPSISAGSPAPAPTEKRRHSFRSKPKTAQVGEATLQQEPKTSKFSNILKRVHKRSREIDPKQLFKDRLSQHQHPSAFALLDIQTKLNDIIENPALENRQARASEILVDLMRKKLFTELQPDDPITTDLILDFIDLYRTPLVTLFDSSPLHVGFILIYPAEAGLKLTDYTERNLGWLNLDDVPAWSRIAFNVRNSIGNIVTARLAEIFTLSIDSKSSSEKMKTRTFSEFAQGLLKLEPQQARILSQFFQELSVVCGKLCTELLMERDFAPKLALIPTNFEFEQKLYPDAKLISTPDWQEQLAQRSIADLQNELMYRIEDYILHLPLSYGEVQLFSAGKAFDGTTDTHSGDAAQSFQLAKGVSAHVVVDSAGSKKTAFEAASFLTGFVKEYLDDHQTFNLKDGDLVEFLRNLLTGAFSMCVLNGYECTMTFNLIFPGEDGTKLLVGFSAGDTWVFTRKSVEPGKYETEVLTPNVRRAMHENAGALGNTVLSTSGLFDVYVKKLKKYEQVFFASDAVRDCWETLSPSLTKLTNPIVAMATPFFKSHRLISNLRKIAADQKVIASKFNEVSVTYTDLRNKVMESLHCDMGNAEKQIDALHRLRMETKGDLDQDYDLRESIGLSFVETQELLQCHQQKMESDKAGKIVTRIANQLNNLSGTLSPKDEELLDLLGVKKSENELKVINKLLSLKRDDLTILGVY